MRLSAVLLTIAACLGPATYLAADAPARPNIVLIVIDTLRADHLGCYGYERPTTPHIDALAGDALVFRNAATTAPWTLPSMATLFTSQYPSVLGIGSGPARFDDRFTTLAEVLQKSGYRTHAVVSAALVGAKFGFARGFESYDESYIAGHQDISSPLVVEAAIRFLEERRNGRFFLYLHLFDPHYDYMDHELFDYREPEYRGPIHSGLDILTLWQMRSTLQEEDVRHLLALYDSEISFTDLYVGRVLKELRARGMYDESLVILTSDHGEEFMERGWIGHCISLHEEQLRVPLLVKLPGNRGASIEAPVSFVDVMPSILGFLGLEAPEESEGRSLDLRSPETIRGTPLFGETSNPQIHQPGGYDPIDLKSVRLGDRKLICDLLADTCRLFVLDRDPYEMKDVYAKKRKEAEALRSLLRVWIRRIGAREPTAEQPELNELLTPKELERLRSLGYIQ